MDNKIKVSGWELIKKLLVLFKFTNKEIEQVKFDLERISQMETFAGLLVALPIEQRQMIEQKVRRLTPEAANKEIKLQLSLIYSETDINDKMSQVITEVFQDYLKHMLEKVTDPVKQDQVAEVIAELAKIQ